MSVASVEFLGALLVLSALFVRLPGAAARRLLFALCNLAFLATFLSEPISWLVLAAFLGSGYLAARLLQRRPSTVLLSGYLVALVAAFACLQGYELVALLGGEALLVHGVHLIGLSYMLFRQIHFVVDARQGQIESTSVWSYLNYQLNLFGLLAGPIQRYDEFMRFWEGLDGAGPGESALDGHALRLALLRIFVGAIKVAGIAPLCLFAHDKVAALLLVGGGVGQSAAATLLELAVLFYLYPVYIYFNFSGYCDVVIAGASLIGLPMPENFDRPWRSRNMIDFWNRWHRTLSFWVRDYVFMTTYRGVARRLPKQSNAMAPLCLFAALLVAGLWHGSTLNWVIYGVLNGLGVAAARLWENVLVARRGRKGLRAYLADRRIEALAIFCNLHFVCFTVLFFHPDLERNQILLDRLWHALAALVGAGTGGGS